MMARVPNLQYFDVSIHLRSRSHAIQLNGFLDGQSVDQIMEKLKRKFIENIHIKALLYASVSWSGRLWGSLIYIDLTHLFTIWRGSIESPLSLQCECLNKQIDSILWWDEMKFIYF